MVKAVPGTIKYTNLVMTSTALMLLFKSYKNAGYAFFEF